MAVPTIRHAVTISMPAQRGCSDGKRAKAASIKKKRTIDPARGKAGLTRNNQCLRTTILTSSPFSCPEKCHCLSRPRRKVCRPQRARPERQGSSSGSADLFLLGRLKFNFGALMLMVHLGSHNTVTITTSLCYPSWAWSLQVRLRSPPVQLQRSPPL